MLEPDWSHWVFGKMHGPTTDHSDLTCMGWAIHRRKMDDSFMPNLQKVLHTYLPASESDILSFSRNKDRLLRFLFWQRQCITPRKNI